jgi:cytochrome c5
MFLNQVPRLALGLLALFLALHLLALAGCGREGAMPAASAPASAPPKADARLADARLAGLYERACANCHEAAGSGAPRRGDRAAWAPRESGGLPALVASVRAGKGAMPPMGWCPECTDEDFAMLVSYLRGIDAP